MWLHIFLRWGDRAYEVGWAKMDLGMNERGKIGGSIVELLSMIWQLLSHAVCPAPALRALICVLCQPLWTPHGELSLAPPSTGPQTSRVQIHVKLKIDVCSSVLHSLQHLGGIQVTARNSGWFGGYGWWNLRRLCWWNNSEVHWKVLPGEIFFPLPLLPPFHSQPRPKSKG